MSVRDPRDWSEEPKRNDRAGRGPLADLSDRLARARRAGEPAPEELERLVSLLSQSDYEPSERLTHALEGLARWTGAEEARAPRAAAPQRRQPVPAELESRLVDFANSIADKSRPAPSRSAARPADPRTPPIASLRAALAEIAERQKTLDASEEPPLRRAPARAPEQRSAEPRRSEPEAAQRPAAARDPRLEIEPRRTYAPQAQPQKPTISPAMIDGVRAEIDRLGRSVSDLPTRREVDSLTRELSALAGRISADRPARLDPASLGAIDALVSEVDRMRREAASPQMIADLAEELHAISSRLDVLGPTSTSAIDAVVRRVDEVRAELAHFPRATAVDTLASEIQSLIERLDAQERAAAPTRQAVVGLASRVESLDGKIAHMAEAVAVRDDALQRANASLRAELDTLPRAEAVTDLGRQIDALTESLKNRSAIGPALKAVEGLTTRVEALDGKIDHFAKVRAGETEWLAEAMRDEIAAAARPNALDGLERQIAALTARLSGQRDDEVSDDVRSLSTKIDGFGDRLSSVAQATGARHAAFERIEESVRAIAERLVHPGEPASGGQTDAAALEAEVARLVDGLERNDGRLDDLNAAFAGLAARIEQSCADLGARYETSAASAIRSASEAASGPRVDDRIEDEISRALSELRASAAQSERRAADALDAVRSTLERMLDRMEQMEAAPQQQRPAAMVPHAFEDRRPEPETRVDAAEAARAAARRALAEIAAGDEPPAPRMPRIDDEAYSVRPDLSPDHPMEPGSGAPNVEAASGPNAASFIAAARRAAAQPAGEPEPLRAAPRGLPGSSGFSGAIAKLKASKRPFLLGLAATLIVFAALYVANGMTGEPADTPPPPAPQSRLAPDLAPERNAYRPAVSTETPRAEDVPEARGDIASRDEAPPPSAARDAGPQPETGRDPALEAKAASTPERAPEPGAPQRAPQGSGFAFGDAAELPKSRTVEWKAGEPVSTGSIARTAPGGLPAGIGGATLRARATAGDAAAQLEVADRLLEGRNVEADAASAAIWLERAAVQGLAPAQHRLGSLYEKGRGVTRDVPAARRWYEQAAASGNVRAMHNLGVVYAEGGLGKPDYNAAAVWFRMAAERGLVDSQYNLAVLDARGLSGKRDLVEAYKWFALAAAQGDEDAGKKREEVAKALGSQLGAAKTAAETFRPRAVEPSANDVPAPAGGWDRAVDRREAAAPR